MVCALKRKEIEGTKQQNGMNEKSKCTLLLYEYIFSAVCSSIKLKIITIDRNLKENTKIPSANKYVLRWIVSIQCFSWSIDAVRTSNSSLFTNSSHSLSFHTFNCQRGLPWWRPSSQQCQCHTTHSGQLSHYYTTKEYNQFKETFPHPPLPHTHWTHFFLSVVAALPLYCVMCQ